MQNTKREGSVTTLSGPTAEGRGLAGPVPGNRCVHPQMIQRKDPERHAEARMTDGHPDSDITRLILVRHGDAHAGFHGPIGGAKGCRGLTDLGRRQAERLRMRLAESGEHAPDVLVTSEIPRAIETAGIIAPALGFDEVPQDCDLCEVHTGEADGLDWKEYADIYGTVDMAAEPDRPFAPGGDSFNSFRERVERVVHRLVADHRGKEIMVVCHAGVIGATLNILFASADEPVRLTPTHTSLTEWSHDASVDRWTLRAYNDAAHLRGLREEIAT